MLAVLLLYLVDHSPTLLLRAHPDSALTLGLFTYTLLVEPQRRGCTGGSLCISLGSRTISVT